LKNRGWGQLLIFNDIFVAIGLKPINPVLVNYRQAYSRNFKKLEAIREFKFFRYLPPEIDRPVETLFQLLNPAFFE